MNSADKLFEQVMSDIGKNGLSDRPDWPDIIPRDDVPTDEFDRFPTDDEIIRPIGDQFDIDRAIERLTGIAPDAVITDEENEIIGGAVRHLGLDTLAFYKSRRFKNIAPFVGKWGIFYFKKGIDYIAKEISTSYPGYGAPTNLAYNFLRAHEFVHYKCDLQTLMFEAVLKRNLYVPLHKALIGRKVHFVEESLANSAALRWAKKKQISIQDFAEDFMNLQPGAYARFLEPNAVLQGEWIANVLDLKPPYCKPRTDIAKWVDAVPNELLRKSLCPEYIIDPKKIKHWLSPALVLPPVKLISDERPVTKVLKGKYRNLEKKWQNTKKKLIENRLSNGLNFKPWKIDGNNTYSVKIDISFRAHLRHEGAGNWSTYILGNHKELGHG